MNLMFPHLPHFSFQFIVTTLIQRTEALMLWEDCLFPAFLLQNKTDTAGNTNGKYSFAS